MDMNTQGIGPSKGGDGGMSLSDGIHPRFRALSDTELEVIAQQVHEANRSYQRSIGEAPSPPWGQAPTDQRESCLAGVRKVLAEAGGCPKAFRGLSDEEAQHNSWMEQKLRAGWTYGVAKDPERRTHPCLLPYASLPPEQRRKDRLFRAVVLALDPRAEV